MNSPGIKFKLKTYEDLRAMIGFFAKLAESTKQIAQETEIYQTDLYYHILADLVADKLAAKLLKEPKKYDIKLNHKECLTIYIIIKNEEMHIQNEWLSMKVRQLFLQLDQYLVNNSNKKRWRNKKNYQLESSTNASSLLIDSSKKLDSSTHSV